MNDGGMVSGLGRGNETDGVDKKDVAHPTHYAMSKLPAEPNPQ